MRRVLALLVLTTACGPIEYVSQVTRTASTAVDDARAVDAERFAPYWWTRAVEYLHAAREQAAHANFQAANRFGRLSTDAAVHAKADAIRRAANPALMDEITPPPRPLPKAVDDETPDELRTDGAKREGTP